ncbi:MAG: peptidylprolyl isomerase [Eubacteriales bacterium]|nr:peptidylprolyl isomerase [Eubacteriales bacterium]
MAKCKFCQAELPEGTTLCPQCGEVNRDEKKMTPGKTALVVAAVVVLAALVVALVYAGMNVVVTSEEQVEAAVETVAETVAETEAATVPADGNPDDETAKGTYTASDADVIAARDTVVARVGDKTLTNGQLQMFYWTEVRNFLSSYGAYASYLGFDTTKPLDVQTCALADTACTWQQFFLASALNSWRNYQATAAEAERTGYLMDAEMQAQLDSAVENLEMTAQMYGFESAEALLRSDVGPGAGVEDYQHFLNLYYTGSMYFSDLCEKNTPTDQEVEDYFTANEEAYASSGLTREDKTVDVRHVLIMPEGATSENIRTDTFEDAAWESSRVKAEELLAQWEQGDKSEESFAELAMEHSQDGSASDGGLYTGVQEGQMVEAFNDWCFDDIRQPGDYGLVKTEFGYHLMFFVDSQPIWMESARSDLISARANETLNGILEQYPVEADFDKILLGFVDLNGEAEEEAETEVQAQAQPAAEPVEGDSYVWIVAGVSAALLAAAAFVFYRKEEAI